MKKLTAVRRFEVDLEDLGNNSEYDLEFELMGEVYYYYPETGEWEYEKYIDDENCMMLVTDQDIINALDSLLMKSFENKLWEDIQHIVSDEFTEGDKVDFEFYWDTPTQEKLFKQLLELEKTNEILRANVTILKEELESTKLGESQLEEEVKLLKEQLINLNIRLYGK